VNIDKRWIIGGVLLVGGLLWMRRASAATVEPTTGAVVPSAVTGGGTSGTGLGALASALLASGSPAPAPTYTLAPAPAPAPAPAVTAAAATVAPAPPPINNTSGAYYQNSSGGWSLGYDVNTYGAAGA
jgi:hypothetical protein